MLTQEQAIELAWAVVWSGGSSSNHTHVVQVLGAEGQKIAEHMTESLQEKWRLGAEVRRLREALEAVAHPDKNTGWERMRLAREALGLPPVQLADFHPLQ